MITGADVVDFRRRRHMSRRQLASETGLTEGKIWRIENRGTIHADERLVLERVGVTPTTTNDSLPPEPEPVAPVALVGVHTPVVYRDPPPPTPTLVVADAVTPDVDLATLSEIAQRAFDHYFSNSELQTFKRCRRKWWLGWYRGLHLKTESPVGVRQVGDRLHRALREHYRPGGPTHETHLLEVLERLILEDRQALPDDVDPEVYKKFEDEANLERIMLEGYLAWLAETGADSELEIVAPETYLEAELDEFGPNAVAIIGKLDVRVRRKTDGAILFIDHKSVGNLTQPVLTLTLDEQMLHYDLLEHLNSPDGGHVVGALYNMLRRVKRTVRAQPPFYSRVEVHHNEYELASYRRRIVGLIDDILRVRDILDNTASITRHRAEGARTVVYPSPRRECTWDCPFFAVCPMFDDGSRAEDALKTYYDVGDPHEYYMTEMIGVTE